MGSVTPSQIEVAGSLAFASSESRFCAVRWPYAYFTNAGAHFYVVDLTLPASPTLIGDLRDASNLVMGAGIAIAGDYAFLVAGFNTSGYVWQLTVVSIRDPHAPTVAATLQNSLDSSTTPFNSPSDICISADGNTAFVTNVVANSGVYEITAVDIANPLEPTLIGTFSDATVSQPACVEVDARGYLYVGGVTHLSIFDVSDPASPSLVGSYAQFLFSISLNGRYLIGVASDGTTVYVIDISDPTSPSLTGSVTDGVKMLDLLSITAFGDYACYTCQTESNNFGIIDLTNPAAPTVGETLSVATILGHAYSSVVVGRHAVVAVPEGGVAVIDMCPSGVNEAYGLDAGSLRVATDAYIGRDLIVSGRIVQARDPAAPLTGGDNGLPSNFVSVTHANYGAYTPAAGDFVEADTTAGAFAVPMPSNPAVGSLWACKNISRSANTLTIQPANSGTIDGASTAATTTQWAGAVFESKGEFLPAPTCGVSSRRCWATLRRGSPTIRRRTRCGSRPASWQVQPFIPYGCRLAIPSADLLDPFGWETEQDVVRANGAMNNLGVPAFTMAEVATQGVLSRINGVPFFQPGSADFTNALMLPIDGLWGNCDAAGNAEVTWRMWLQPQSADLCAIAFAGSWIAHTLYRWRATQYQWVDARSRSYSSSSYALRVIVNYWDFTNASASYWYSDLFLTTGDFPANVPNAVTWSLDDANGLIITAGAANKQQATSGTQNSPVTTKMLPFSGDQYCGTGLWIPDDRNSYSPTVFCAAFPFPACSATPLRFTVPTLATPPGLARHPEVRCGAIPVAESQRTAPLRRARSTVAWVVSCSSSLLG